MPTYLWNKNLNLGISDIDHQHKQLINALRELQIGLYDEVSLADVQRQLEDMAAYCVEHFGAEERLMEPYKDKLPSYNRHIAEHKAFCAATVGLQSKFEEKGAAVAEEIFRFLAQWLEQHIKGTDKVMCDELLEVTEGNSTKLVFDSLETVTPKKKSYVNVRW